MNKEYKKYLKSENWKQKRFNILMLIKKCEVCGSKNNLPKHKKITLAEKLKRKK